MDPPIVPPLFGDSFFAEVSPEELFSGASSCSSSPRGECTRGAQSSPPQSSRVSGSGGTRRERSSAAAPGGEQDEEAAETPAAVASFSSVGGDPRDDTGLGQSTEQPPLLLSCPRVLVNIRRMNDSR